MKSTSPETNPAPVVTTTDRRRVSIGLPANSAGGEKRVPLTPEAVKWLVDSFDNNPALSVIIESGAGQDIHYTDARYSHCGASVRDHASTLRADIVITSAGLPPADVAALKRNSLWITLLSPDRIDADILRAVLRRHITVISLMHVTDSSGRRHISDTLAEVEGRAAITVSAGLLADGIYGKGILLGGVAGIVPCEVVVIGAGIAGIAAAKGASGAGATVRVFDDNPSKLRQLTDSCSGMVIPSSLHREVFLRAVATADIIINTLPSPYCGKARLSADDLSTLKKEAIIIDTSGGDAFPSIRNTDLTPAPDKPLYQTGHRCFTNVCNAVPRTASMAISNCLVPLIEKIVTAPTIIDSVRMEQSIKAGLVAIGGQIVNRDAAAASSLNFVDPSIFLHLS